MKPIKVTKEVIKKIVIILKRFYIFVQDVITIIKTKDN